MQVSDYDTSAGTSTVNDGDHSHSSESGIHSPDEDVDSTNKSQTINRAIESNDADNNNEQTVGNGATGTKSQSLRASTPRRRKDMVAKLKSSLSPKYIGFCATPTGNGHNENGQRTRYLRGRKLSRRADNSPITPSSRIPKTESLNDATKASDAVDIEETQDDYNENCIHRIPAHGLNSPTHDRIPPTKQFVSPIEELLIRNGSKTLTPPLKILFDNDLNEECAHSEGAAENCNTIDNAGPGSMEEEEEEEDFSPEIINITAITDNSDKVCSSEEAKSPSALSTDSAKGSSIMNGNSWSSCTTGDLFWGQLFSYCYWPCMACPDPDGKITQAQSVGTVHDDEYVHVRFFADNGRRNWVTRQKLLTYNGYSAYKRDLLELREKLGKNSPKYKAFLPKQRQKHIWHEAIREADIVAQTEYAQRLEKFYEIFERK